MGSKNGNGFNKSSLPIFQFQILIESNIPERSVPISLVGSDNLDAD